MESLDLPQELYWDPKLEPASPPSAVASELFSLDDPTTTFLYDDNFANGQWIKCKRIYLYYICSIIVGITLLSVDEADILQKAATMGLLSDEDFVVEFSDLKDEGKLTKFSLEPN